MNYPTISVIITTRNRTKVAKETIKYLIKNLKYSGDINYIISDDGSYNGHVNELLWQFSKDGISNVKTLLTNQYHHGLGASLNNSLKTAFETGDIVLTCEDDWILEKEIDITNLVTLLVEHDDIGMIRLAASSKCNRVQSNYPGLDKVIGENQYSSIMNLQVALRHKRLYDTIGQYKENVSSDATENDMIRRFNKYSNNGTSGLSVLILSEIKHSTLDDQSLYFIHVGKSVVGHKFTIPKRFQYLYPSPFFSVIIPLWNCEKFIEKAIKSIMSQSFTDYEVIIVDDCSTDNSIEVVENLISRNKDQITLIKNSANMGGGAARNIALTNASGQYILFLDADDEFTNYNVFQTIHDTIIQSENPDAIKLSFNIKSKKGIETKSFSKNMAEREMIKFESPWSLCTKREICPTFVENRKRFNDVVWYYKSIDRAQTITAIENPIITYYTDENHDSVQHGKKDRDWYASVPYLIGDLISTKFNKQLVNEIVYETIMKKEKDLCYMINTKLQKDFNIKEKNIKKIKREISIIIPCHNSEDNIGKIIAVFQNQTETNWEIICVDDSENDNTKNEIEKFSNADNRIKYIMNIQPNSPGLSRNIGLDNSTGEYVWFIDSDDGIMLENDGLSNIIKIINEHDDCDFNIIQSKMFVNGEAREYSFVEKSKYNGLTGKIIERKNIKNKTNWQKFIKSALYNPWNKIFKRDFLTQNPEIRFQNVEFCNDVIFSINCFKSFNKVHFIDLPPIYAYNRSANSISGTKYKSEHLDVLQKVLKALSEIEFDDEYLKNALMNERVDKTEKILFDTSIATNTSEEETVWKMADIFNSETLKKYEKYIKGYNGILSKIQKYQKSRETIVHEGNKENEAGKIPVDFQFGIKEPLKHDAVFVLGGGSKHCDEELSLAMASLFKFCGSWLGNVYVVGSKPRCSLEKYEYDFIPCEDPYENKDANIIYKTKYAIENIPGLTENFLLCSDDQIVTKNCAWDDFQPMSVTRFKRSDEEFYNWCHNKNKKGRWLEYLYKTLRRFNDEKYPVYFYEPHVWSPINKTSFSEMCKSIDLENETNVIVFTLYYNYIEYRNPKPKSSHSFFSSPAINWKKKFDRCNSRFIAYNDEAYCEKFKTELIKIIKANNGIQI